jgi:hypothetical protein
MWKKHFQRGSLSFMPMPLPLLSMTLGLTLFAVSWFVWERARYAAARRQRRLHYRHWVQERPAPSTPPRQDALARDSMNPQRALQIRLDAEAAARQAWATSSGEPANPHARHTAAAVLWTASYHLTWLTLAEASESLETA